MPRVKILFYLLSPPCIQQVCGTDNKTYDSSCQFFATKCALEGTKKGHKLHLDYIGPCKCKCTWLHTSGKKRHPAKIQSICSKYAIFNPATASSKKKVVQSWVFRCDWLAPGSRLPSQGPHTQGRSWLVCVTPPHKARRISICVYVCAEPPDCLVWRVQMELIHWQSHEKKAELHRHKWTAENVFWHFLTPLMRFRALGL